MSLTQLRATAARFNLLQHSFYTRWTAGELSREELQAYAGEYHHVAAAMPGWLDQMASQDPAHAPSLRRHAREEAAHVPMWDDFSEALGCDRAALQTSPPNHATRALLECADGLVAAGRGAGVMWAVESQAPAVSEAKLAGLRQHYGLDGGAATRYFEVHTTMDVAHTRELEKLVEAGAPAAGHAEAAELVLRGMFGLLSSVEHEAVAV